jgi:hypothetical protein
MIGRDQTRFGCCPQREGGRRGVAAHAARVGRAAQIVAVEFGQAVHKTRQPLRRGVQVTVDRRILVGVTQPEIGAEIDQARGEGGVIINVSLRFAVRQREKEQIVGLQRVAAGKA